MNDTTITPGEIKSMARMIAEDMPEFLALQKRLRAESRNVRRAVASFLVDWAYDPTTDMSPEERDARLAEVKAELARRGEAA